MRFFYILFFLSISIYCYAQDSLALIQSPHPHSKYSVSLAFGTCLPNSDFSTYNANIQSQINQSVGYAFGNAFAEPGIAANIDCDYTLINHKIELTCSLSYAYTPFDIENYTNFLYSYEGYFATNLKTTGYNIFTFLPGIKYPFIKGKFAFYLKAMLGVLVCEAPNFSYTEYYIAVYGYSNPLKVIETSGIGNDIALNLGAGAEYQISKNIHIICSADHISSSPTVHINGSLGKGPLVIPISAFNLELGIDLAF